MKTLLLGQDPSYNTTCHTVLLDVGITDIVQFNDVKLASQFLQANNVLFVVVSVIEACSEEWKSFLDYLNSVRIPFVVASSNNSDLLIDHAISFQSQGFYSFPVDQTSFSFYVKKLLLEIEKNQNNKFFVIRHKRVYVNILQEQIIKIITQGNYSYVFLTTGKKHVVKKPLKRLLEKLDPKLIIQCHRSTAFNITMLERIEMVDRKLILMNGEVLKLGNNYKHLVKSAMELRFD